MKTTKTQVGGNYYTKLAIQPMRYSMENKLDPCQHTIIKYVTRFRDKGGMQDLLKAKHVLEMLIEYAESKVLPQAEKVVLPQAETNSQGKDE